MRSYRVSATALALLFTFGCGGDGGSGPSNQAPTANFEPPLCNELSCAFTDGSTDGDGTIASRAWTFENGTPATSTDANPTVAFSAGGTFAVTLTVTDNDGATDDFSRDVTVTGVPGNTSPVAEFDASCNSLDCTFTDQSSDPDAGDGIASWSWDFGDGATSTDQNPTHSYTVTVLTTETVGLTVTDNNGASKTKTHNITVAPPAGLQCNGSDCSLTLTNASVVTVTLVSEDCNADGNTFIITNPAPPDTLFTDGCHSPAPGTPAATFTLNNGAAYTAGTELQAKVVSGSSSLGSTPTIRVTGVFPDWTLEFDDGEGCPGDPTCGGTEPDFNDLVLTVHAQ